MRRLFLSAVPVVTRPLHISDSDISATGVLIAFLPMILISYNRARRAPSKYYLIPEHIAQLYFVSRGLHGSRGVTVIYICKWPLFDLVDVVRTATYRRSAHVGTQWLSCQPTVPRPPKLNERARCTYTLSFRVSKTFQNI